LDSCELTAHRRAFRFPVRQGIVEIGGGTVPSSRSFVPHPATCRG
jgi:hypothetical protein